MIVATGQLPQVSSMVESAAAPEQVVVPEQTRSTGSPEHDPMGVVQAVVVPAVLLHPTEYERPGVHEKDPLRRQPHSREMVPQVAVVHAAVGSPVVGTSTPESRGPPERQLASALCTDAQAGAAGVPDEQSMGASVRHPR